MPQIVQVNVTQTIAPIPDKLQRTGIFVSQGATITTPGTLTLLTQLADLSPALRGARAISTLAWAAGVVTATTAAPHGYDIGDTIELTVAGATPTGYNGTYLCTITGASTFTYVRSNPGVMTVAGTFTPEDVSELNAMATTFFSQGSSVSVYVLELGAGTVEEGVAALSDYVIANPFEIYGALVPRLWDANPDFLAFIATQEATTAKFYLWVTTKLQTFTEYTEQMKDVIALVETPQQHIFPSNDLTALDYNGEHVALSATVATSQSGSGSYAPGNNVEVDESLDDPPSFTINTTVLASATIAAGGTGGTPGAVVLTGTTGTGTKFQIAGTISGGGVLTAVGAISVAGSYTVNPTLLTAEPVTGGGLTGATLNIKMGIGTVTVLDAGAVHTLPDNPVDLTALTGTGTGGTLNIVWQADALNGQITGTTTTAHGVNVGDTFQLAGVSPTGYNTFYTALPGTAGNTLVASLYVDPGVVTVLGSLVASTAEADTLPSTEFSLAAAFWVALHYNPSTTNKVTPFAFSYLFGVTPWVTKGNNAILTLLKNASINYVATGAEGGISNTALFWGTTKDARDFTYWYSVDWMQINAARNIANAVINGSNNSINPLYYDQHGIDRLQDVVVSTTQTAVSVGLANGVPARAKLTGPEFVENIENGKYDGMLICNAVPFLPYLRDNPSDYRIGHYAGLSLQYIPNRGFISILFNINVTDFVVA